MAKGFFNQDMALFLDHRVDWERYFSLSRGPGTNAAEELDTYKAVLQAAAEVCEAIEARSAGHWHEEVLLEQGRVVVPPHIADGYGMLREAGLLCLMLSPEYGGSGLPALLNCYVLEMISRADTSLMTIVGLQAGVAIDIEKYGSEALKRQYLPRFIAGELQGAMDLTEAQAGSDLGAIRTKAVRDGDRWWVDGEKIFITNGGAEVHLVLARDGETYEQSKGTTHGLNLMLVPRTLPDGRTNGVRVARLESKLGIHGSPTAVVELDHAEAWLLGERGNGFRAMLDLMNNARVGVAAQALGIAEGAYHAAREYAAQRVQFGAPIIEQPLVKSMLTLMAINIQAARALLYRTSALADTCDALRKHLASPRGQADPNGPALEAELERRTQLLRFFTPLCKYYATEISNHVTRQGIQVHGGLGYMAESVAGHYHSDSIITTIYEGTSEIQASFALKEMGKGALGETLAALREELEPMRAEHPKNVHRLCEAIGLIEQATPALMTDLSYALLNAKRICEMVIDVVVGTELLCQVGHDASRDALATSFINRHSQAVRMNAERIATGDATRIQRYDRILGV
jgi:alkylation response protein AidB-like acyl-CoA dehydrogenase